MHKKINYLIFLSLFIIVFVFIINYIKDKKLENNTYEKNLFYMDTYMYISFYTEDKNKANEALNKIDEIYEYYHKLTNRYTNYEGINNLYYINYNDSTNDSIKIDKELYNLIKYGKDLYNKSNGKIDISIGNITDVWHSYRESKIGIPTITELNNANKGNIDDIILLDNNKIKNNHPNIDLGCIAKGYATAKVGQYFKSIGIKEYLINAGGNVLVGKKKNNKKYTVGLEDPNSTTGGIFKVIKVENKSVVTSGGYERYYEYNNKKYHHIIDPDTLYPSDNMKSVSVIASDSTYADFLATYLFLLSVEDGKKYIDSIDDVEAIWYTNDDKIVTSKGIEKYE